MTNGHGCDGCSWIASTTSKSCTHLISSLGYTKKLSRFCKDLWYETFWISIRKPGLLENFKQRTVCVSDLKWCNPCLEQGTIYCAHLYMVPRTLEYDEITQTFLSIRNYLFAQQSPSTFSTTHTPLRLNNCFIPWIYSILLS